MFRDLTTVIWKEVHEIFGRRDGGRARWTKFLVFFAVFGIFLPLQNGRGWVASPLVLVYWAWIPFLLVSGVVADAFAGERERHTLETLLASRLPDRAILFGKIGAALLYGWGVTLACVAAGTVTVSLAFGRGRLLLYPAPIAAGIGASTFLVALLGAGLGVLISLRAATVRQAQQTFSIASFALFIPLFLVPLLPASAKAAAARWAAGADVSTILLVALGILAALDAGLLVAGAARFRRARLILD